MPYGIHRRVLKPSVSHDCTLFLFLGRNFFKVTFQVYFPCVFHVCKYIESYYTVLIRYFCPKIQNHEQKCNNLNYICKRKVEKKSHEISSLKFSLLPKLQSVSIYDARHMQNKGVNNCNVVVFLRRKSLHLTYTFPRMNPERFLARYCSDAERVI